MTGIPNTVNIQQDTPNTVSVNQEDQNLVTVQTTVNNVTVTTGSIATGATRRHVHTQGSVSMVRYNIYLALKCESCSVPHSLDLHT